MNWVKFILFIIVGVIIQLFLAFGLHNETKSKKYRDRIDTTITAYYKGMIDKPKGTTVKGTAAMYEYIWNGKTFEIYMVDGDFRPLGVVIYQYRATGRNFPKTINVCIDPSTGFQVKRKEDKVRYKWLIVSVVIISILALFFMEV